MANIARLGVVLGLNTAEFQTGLKGAMQGLDTLKSAAKIAGTAILVAGAALAYMTKKSIDNMDSMSKLSQSVGVSVEALSSMSYAANLSGVSTDELAKRLGVLTKGMSDAAIGTGEAKRAFDTLGMNAGGLQSADEALLQIADKFADMEDGAQKTAIALQLFGRSGMAMIPFLNMGSDGIAELQAEATKLGITLNTSTAQAAERFNDNLTRLRAIGEGLTNQLASSMLPALENLTSAFFDAYVEADETNEAANTLSKNKMPEWARGAALAFAILADSVIFALKTISALDKAFGAVGDNVDYRSAQIKRFALSMTAPLIGDPSPELQKKLDDLDKKIFNLGMTALDSTNLVNDLFGDAANMTFSNMLRKSIDSNTVDISQNPTRPTRPAFSGESSKEQDSINKKINERLKAVKKIVGEYAREQDYQLELMDIQNQMLGMTNNQREIQESINNVLTATSEKLQKIAEQRLQAADTGANQTILDQFDQQSDAVQELSDKYVALARAQTESSIDAQMTFSYGWNTAFAQFAEDAQNYASVAADMFGSLVNNMNSAIDKFVDNGKLSFSDFAESVIKDIIKIQLKMQASQLLQMGIGFAMSAFSAGAGGATAFGPGSTAGGAGALSFPVRANGGTITGPSIVGERGAELFVPGRSGAIIPNNNLNDSMGGGGVTYNGPVIQNMQAIDTQSGIQFLAKNKMTIWSMNQSANRSIPAGR